MRLEQLVHDLEDRLVGLGKRLWREDAAAARYEEAEAVGQELHEQTEALTACRRSLDEVRGRLRAGEMRAALLASQVETYLHVADQGNAWKLALELDRVREQLRQDREQEAALERAVWQHRIRGRQLERRLASLQAALYQTA